MVESETGVRGQIIMIKHRLDPHDGKRYLRFDLFVREAADGVGRTHGPYQPHQIRASLLERMAETAKDDD